MAHRASLLAALADAVRPLERLSPSAFAERYRQLKPGAGPFAGAWRNAEPVPYLVDVMDAPAEAIEATVRAVASWRWRWSA